MKKILIASTFAVALAGCGPTQTDRTLTGAALGGVTGAAIGGLATGTGGGGVHSAGLAAVDQDTTSVKVGTCVGARKGDVMPAPSRPDRGEQSGNRGRRNVSSVGAPFDALARPV